MYGMNVKHFNIYKRQKSRFFNNNSLIVDSLSLALKPLELSFSHQPGHVAFS